MGIEFWSPREDQQAQLYCSRCKEIDRDSIVAVVRDKIVYLRQPRGWNKQAVIEDAWKAKAQDPRIADPIYAADYRKAVRENRKAPLPGVKVERVSRTEWRPLVGKHETVSCSYGHRVQVHARRYEGIVYLDYHGKQVSFY